MLSKNSVIFLLSITIGIILIFFWTSHNLLKKNIDSLDSDNKQLTQKNQTLSLSLITNEKIRLSIIKERDLLKFKNDSIINKVKKEQALLPLIKKEYINLSVDSLKKIIIIKYEQDSITTQDSTTIKDASELIQIPKKIVIGSIAKYDEGIIKDKIIVDKDAELNNKDKEIKLADTQIGTYKNDSSITHQIITNDSTMLSNKDSEIKIQKKIIRNQKLVIIGEAVLTVLIIIISL